MKEFAGEQNEEAVQIGDVVFAKMVGYPWWPGVVEEESTLPEDIAEQRPTESEAEANGMGRTTDLFAVRFLGDSSYAWLPHSALIHFRPNHPKLLKKNFKSSRKSSRSLFRVGIEEATVLWEANKIREAEIHSETVESSSSCRILPSKTMGTTRASTMCPLNKSEKTVPKVSICLHIPELTHPFPLDSFFVLDLSGPHSPSAFPAR